MSAIKYISELMAHGQYCFSTREANTALGSTPIAVRAALRRLRQKAGSSCQLLP
ncbi:MAG TPA: hypothetical protein PLT06_10175 [Syntrophorhabdaceae bacterium]|jgi:hypothetical protein|nr:hypothetical protein [Syntrophorhabdaceae bacterium]MDI9561617.1 hypothetical protein [Pseudomonadota bacterium]HQG51809.1 hypothetical protein [Syntrophorhabdaceae bacterium]HQJ95185.1 hypothetical protein [Syntrophorhabdaceae bacterium]